MPSKTPHSNGDKPVENGVHNDANRNDSKTKGKKGAKDGDEEMTVVVPPSKDSKKSQGADADGDVSMGDEATEAPVDPAAQAVAGKCFVLYRSNDDLARFMAMFTFLPKSLSTQISRATLHCSTAPLLSSMPDFPSAPCDPSPSPANA